MDVTDSLTQQRQADIHHRITPDFRRPGSVRALRLGPRLVAACPGLSITLVQAHGNSSSVPVEAGPINTSLLWLVPALLIVILLLIARHTRLTRDVRHLARYLRSRPLQPQESLQFPTELTRSGHLAPLLPVLEQEHEQLLTQLRQEREHLQQTRAEQERMIAANRLLEAGVAERNRELDARTFEVNETLNALRMTRQQLLEKEQQSMLGELLAGLAHEVNTPLAIGSSTLDSLIQELSVLHQNFPATPHDCESMLQHIVDAVQLAHSNIDRAAETVQRFKEVSVDQASGQTREFEAGDYIHSVMWSLRPHYRYRPIEIRIECPHPIYITGVPGIFAQIITNLMMNALLHAFNRDDSGTIDITATRVGEQLCLCFRDNGRGMDQQTLEKVFQPFFTTRRQEGGSGLGAHIVYDLVVNQLHGNIRILSEPEQGTRYQMLIPCQIRGQDAYNACSVYEEYCKC